MDHDKKHLIPLLAILSGAVFIGSPALAQDTPQNTNGAATLSAPVVQVPTNAQEQQAYQQAYQQAQQQAQQQQAQPQAPYQQPPAQQVQVPQQSWGYAYRPPVGYPAAGYGYQVPAQQPQFHYEERERATKSLWVPGMILFGVGWIGNFGIATPLANAVSNDRPAAVEEDAWAWSVVPIVGPIAQLVTGAPHPAIPITMGLMQVGGLALFIAGLVTKETVQVRVVGPPQGQGTTVDLDAVPVEGGGMFRLTVGHL